MGVMIIYDVLRNDSDRIGCGFWDNQGNAGPQIHNIVCKLDEMFIIAFEYRMKIH
jgi:hypothetical protein